MGDDPLDGGPAHAAGGPLDDSQRHPANLSPARGRLAESPHRRDHQAADRRATLVAMRVLLVEDEVGLADAIARGLAAEGFEVEAVHDGLEGLERAREHRYAAMILDIMLPGMNGYQVCRTLRAEGIWTPILMLTAKDGEWDEAEALDTGADDFLSKPFSFVVLVARLRALLRRDVAPRPAVLEVGDLRLDPATHEVHRGGEPIALTAREFALLEHLMRHHDEVVSKAALLEEVWGDDGDGDPNVVEVYVGYLRRKIDAPFGRRSPGDRPRRRLPHGRRRVTIARHAPQRRVRLTLVATLAAGWPCCSPAPGWSARSTRSLTDGISAADRARTSPCGRPSSPGAPRVDRGTGAGGTSCRSSSTTRWWRAPGPQDVPPLSTLTVETTSSWSTRPTRRSPGRCLPAAHAHDRAVDSPSAPWSWWRPRRSNPSSDSVDAVRSGLLVALPLLVGAVGAAHVAARRAGAAAGRGDPRRGGVDQRLDARPARARARLRRRGRPPRPAR